MEHLQSRFQSKNGLREAVRKLVSFRKVKSFCSKMCVKTRFRSKVSHFVSALSSIYIISFWISHFRQLSIYVLCFGHPMEYGYRLYIVLDTLWIQIQIICIQVWTPFGIQIQSIRSFGHPMEYEYRLYIVLDTLWNINIEYTQFWTPYVIQIQSIHSFGHPLEYRQSIRSFGDPLEGVVTVHPITFHPKRFTQFQVK